MARMLCRCHGEEAQNPSTRPNSTGLKQREALRGCRFLISFQLISSGILMSLADGLTNLPTSSISLSKEDRHFDRRLVGGEPKMIKRVKSRLDPFI
jgi:hypothetical protein